jgi:hypothetical protein
MKVMRSKLWMAAPLALSLAVGCQKSNPQAGETGQPTSDQQVAVDVQAKILGDSAVTNKQMTINANSGVVTLSGQVSSDAERNAAAGDAASVAGVKTVVNNLTVSNAAMAQPAQVETPQVPAQTAERARRTPHERNRPSPALVTSAQNNNAPVRNYSDNGNGPMTSTTAQNVTPQPAPPPPPPPAPVKLTVPAGTGLSVRLTQPLASDTNHDGDTFHATLDSPIVIDDKTAIPAGADVEGRVVSVKAAGKFAGQPQLALALYGLSYNGHHYNLDTDQWSKVGNSRTKNSAEKIGGGAAVGAILGGIFGGGKGAAIGAASGGGLGAGAQAISKAQQVRLDSEAVLSFRLQNPITVTAADNNADANNATPHGRRRLNVPDNQ